MNDPNAAVRWLETEATTRDFDDVVGPMLCFIHPDEDFAEHRFDSARWPTPHPHHDVEHPDPWWI